MLARAAWMEAVGKLQSIPEHDIIPTCLFDEDGVTGGLVVTEPEDLEMDVMVELESVRVLESIMEDDEEEEEEREEMTAVETCGR
ncbi:hypothetical protein HK104_008857 [Borealophlyctis nickersoniae]|nr:hypothetical protein HK104_008857 [Borealophlyctis nickersoniae]